MKYNPILVLKNQGGATDWWLAFNTVFAHPCEKHNFYHFWGSVLQTEYQRGMAMIIHGWHTWDNFITNVAKMVGSYCKGHSSDTKLQTPPNVGLDTYFLPEPRRRSITCQTLAGIYNSTPLGQYAPFNFFQPWVTSTVVQQIDDWRLTLSSLTPVKSTTSTTFGGVYYMLTTMPLQCSHPGEANNKII